MSLHSLVLVVIPPHSFFHRNAGGRTSDLTSEMVKTCQGLIGIETCMHLTCTNMPKEKVDIALTVGPFPKMPTPFNFN